MTKHAPKKLTTWRSRIVGHGTEVPDQLLANPFNFRIHPKAQQDALAGLLDQVGWVQDIIVNQRTGHVVDGHLRVSLAISREEPMVPVVYVDLDEAEERLVLASIDPLAAMAVTDADAFAVLMAGVDTEGALADMLAALNGEVDATGFPEMPEGERAPFRQMTFTVTAEQESTIKAACGRAKGGDFGDSGNENSNGNALAAICAEYIG